MWCEQALKQIEGITRQKCRVRIETCWCQKPARTRLASPGRNAGCGLKLGNGEDLGDWVLHHPAEMPGAD